MPKVIRPRHESPTPAVRALMPFILPGAFAIWAWSWEFASGLVVCVALGWMMKWFKTWRTAIPGALMISFLAWAAGAIVYLFVNPPD